MAHRIQEASAKLSAKDVIEMLCLEPLPLEGGFFKRTQTVWPAGVEPAQAARPLGTSIYYLITERSHSKLHRIPHDEIWHFYAGDAARQLQISPEGRATEYTLGNDLQKGERPQLCVSASHWQTTRLVAGGCWALFGATVIPGFIMDELEVLKPSDLASRFPALSQLLMKYHSED